MKTLPLALLVLLALPAAGCLGQGVSASGEGDDVSGTPTPGPSGTPANTDPSLSNGSYNYTNASAPMNSCWAASKNMPALPMPMTMNLTVAPTSIAVDSNVMGAAMSFTWAVSGLDLSGAGAGDANLAAQGIDCTIHIASAFAGTITGVDTFSGTQTVDISVVTGTQCNLLVGTLSPQQFDAMPCSLQLVGSGSK